VTFQAPSGPFVFLSAHFNTGWGSALLSLHMQKTWLEFFDTPCSFVGGVLFSIVWLLMLAKAIYLTMPGIVCLVLYWHAMRKHPE
jgi:hypothetical protein